MTKYLFLLFILLPLTISYNRQKAMQYVNKYVKAPNHKCGKNHLTCSPYAYFGGDYCRYGSHGGDCANFVSQALIAGGHPLLTGGKDYCRGYPCKKEEVGAMKLDQCLHNKFKWKRTCGKGQAPPSNIKIGDVAVFYSGGCISGNAHATIVTSVNGKNVKLSCHSPHVKNVPPSHFTKSKPYISWLHYNG